MNVLLSLNFIITKNKFFLGSSFNRVFSSVCCECFFWKSFGSNHFVSMCVVMCVLKCVLFETELKFYFSLGYIQLFGMNNIEWFLLKFVVITAIVILFFNFDFNQRWWWVKCKWISACVSILFFVWFKLSKHYYVLRF